LKNLELIVRFDNPETFQEKKYPREWDDLDWELGNNNTPFIACLRCGKRLTTFDIVNFQGKYCTQCPNAQREGK